MPSRLFRQNFSSWLRDLDSPNTGDIRLGIKTNSHSWRAPCVSFVTPRSRDKRGGRRASGSRPCKEHSYMDMFKMRCYYNTDDVMELTNTFDQGRGVCCQRQTILSACWAHRRDSAGAYNIRVRSMRRKLIAVKTAVNPTS